MYQYIYEDLFIYVVSETRLIAAEYRKCFMYIMKTTRKEQGFEYWMYHFLSASIAC